MTRKVLSDINDLIKEEPYREEVKVEEIARIKAKRMKKEAFRRKIYNYLRKYGKDIGLLSREDIVIMTEWMDALDKSMFMDQVKYCLETNWWKPIKRIIENEKSILFDKK